MTVEQLASLIKDINPSLEIAPVTVSYGGKNKYALIARYVNPTTVGEGDDLQALVLAVEKDVRADAERRILELEAEARRLRSVLDAPR